MKFALCGNPNVGKTTIFNRMTRSDAPVGNWHGVTVDVREKKIVGTNDTLVDLPGAYSLTAYSNDESVTRDGVLFGGCDAVVFVAEANNLRRNLYLLAQVLEARKKTVLVVNMMDEVRGSVDLELISKRLGIPVIGTSERYTNPRTEIINALKNAKAPIPPYVIGGEITALAEKLTAAAKNSGVDPAFAALKVMEGDKFIIEKLGTDAVKMRAGCGDCGGCSATDRPAALRYSYIDGILVGAVVRKGKVYAVTDKIDKIVLGKAALPIFLLVMAAVFVITFEAGRPLSDMLTSLVRLAADSVRGADMPEWVCGFLSDGIIGGVGSVVAFLPQVLFIFLLTALLQDSGYMSRVAFVTDGFFKRFGLSGRAAFSMILGLGCSATAVLSARGIANTSSRRRAVLATPFVPCSARLSVFTAITAYFGLSGFVVALMYILGFAAAVGALAVMKKSAKTPESDELLMEMPPYRLPSAKRVFKAVFSNIGAFLVRVGTVVLGVGAIMWILSNFSIGYGYTGSSEQSIMSTFAGIIAPVFKPLGFGDWRAVTALISGVAAKETLISVISSLGGMSMFASTAAAVSFLIFTCLYVPCIATLAAIAKEAGAKGVVISIAMHTVVAYTASLLFYGSYVLAQRDTRLLVTLWTCLATAIAAIAVLMRVRHKRRSLNGI